MRPPRVIRCVCLLFDPLVPVVAIPIESARAMPVKDDLVTTKDESRRLVLIANVERVLEPVLNVGAPLHILSSCPYLSSGNCKLPEECL